MTNNEAIKYLKAFELCKPYTMDAQGVYKSAKQCAVKALEENERLKTQNKWLENELNESLISERKLEIKIEKVIKHLEDNRDKLKEKVDCYDMSEKEKDLENVLNTAILIMKKN